MEKRVEAASLIAQRTLDERTGPLQKQENERGCENGVNSEMERESWRTLKTAEAFKPGL